jgi:16S rRNA (guanine527-N7)-methyltransferase
MTQEPILAEVSSAQITTLERFSSLLSGRGVELGVVANADRGDVWKRHVLDSLRALPSVEDPDTAAYDLGSGGGLPGVPIAIARPDLHVGLVESQRRRVAWLELVVEELGISNVGVVARRIEDVRDPVDLCFARALAPAERSWELARPLLRKGGRLAYFAGQTFDPDRVAPDIPVIRILETPLDSGGPVVIIGE